MHTRRDVLGVLVGAPLMASTLSACSREDASQSPVTSRQSPSSPPPRVVIATSTDDFLARPIAKLCEETTGIAVDLITDTEATKAIALVSRVRMSKDRPASDAAIDVWWSSEVLGTIALASDALLAPWPQDASSQSPVASPQSPTSPWREFAARARVIAYHTGRITSDPPRRLRDLTQPRFRGLVAIARPQFGSTRGHIAGLIQLHGEAAVKAWLVALRENEVRVVEGNSAVVRAIAQGEASVGLTDSDDVWVGIDNGWPVGLEHERADDGPVAAGLPSLGSFVFPNTVGVLANAPHPEAAWKVANFLCSPACERAMALSLSRNFPLEPSLREELARQDKRLALPTPIARVDWSAMRGAESAIERCDALLRELFPL